MFIKTSLGVCIHSVIPILLEDFNMKKKNSSVLIFFFCEFWFCDGEKGD